MVNILWDDLCETGIFKKYFLCGFSLRLAGYLAKFVSFLVLLSRGWNGGKCVL